MFIKFKSAAVAAIAVASAAAQTFTDCNPLEKSCPAAPGLNQAEYTVNLVDGVPKHWKMTSGELKTDPEKGGLFQITEPTAGPTIASDFYIFFGYVEMTMQAAPGAGIVSTFVMESADLDELDLEIIGSETTQVQTNYFGKGNVTTYDRGVFVPVESPQTTMHTYAIDWRKETTTWYVDGELVRTLNYLDAVGGDNYPQTPMNIRIGNWVAGQATNQPGTVAWAGGLADMSQAPFNMYVSEIKIKNYTPCDSYTYTDTSGTWESVKCIAASSGTDSRSSGRSSRSSYSGTGTTSRGESSSSSKSTQQAGSPAHNSSPYSISMSASAFTSAASSRSTIATAPSASVSEKDESRYPSASRSMTAASPLSSAPCSNSTKHSGLPCPLGSTSPGGYGSGGHGSDSGSGSGEPCTTSMTAKSESDVRHTPTPSIPMSTPSTPNPATSTLTFRAPTPTQSTPIGGLTSAPGRPTPGVIYWGINGTSANPATGATVSATESQPAQFTGGAVANLKVVAHVWSAWLIPVIMVYGAAVAIMQYCCLRFERYFPLYYCGREDEIDEESESEGRYGESGSMSTTVGSGSRESEKDV